MLTILWWTWTWTMYAFRIHLTLRWERGRKCPMHLTFPTDYWLKAHLGLILEFTHMSFIMRSASWEAVIQQINLHHLLLVINNS